MYQLLRKLFFQVPPERIHYWAMNRLNEAYRIPFLRNWMKKNFSHSDPSLRRTLWGIDFPNPVGLAAGFDKDARFTDALSCLGFGFIEIGTLTPRPQPGNPKPRLFRLPADQALINRMGFNNGGAKAAAQRLRSRKEPVIIGGNIGKNKDTPNEDALSDYLACFEELKDCVDYFVVNVSSPNTPGLRELQEKGPLKRILSALQDRNRALAQPKPLLLKIAPDLTDEQLLDILEIVRETDLDGIVATNTTINRNGLLTPPAVINEIGAGGLSGKPVRDRATEVIRFLHQASGGTVPIIAAGGIFTGADAEEKLRAGASLVQVYTGFIYEGPGIAAAICRELRP